MQMAQEELDIARIRANNTGGGGGAGGIAADDLLSEARMRLGQIPDTLEIVDSSLEMTEAGTPEYAQLMAQRNELLAEQDFYRNAFGSAFGFNTGMGPATEQLITNY